MIQFCHSNYPKIVQKHGFYIVEKIRTLFPKLIMNNHRN